MSLVLKFVESCCYVENGLTEAAPSLWEAYADWCRLCGLTPLKRHDFYRRVRGFFPEKNKPKRFTGVSVRPDEDWEVFNRDDLSRVYLISDGRNVKIGKSLDPKRRLRSLQTARSETELTLLGVIPGGHKVETLLHRKYREKRRNGEWFALTSEDVLDILRGGQEPCDL